MRRTRRGVIHTATGITGLTVAGVASAKNTTHPEWNSTTIYTPGDRVVHAGAVWEARYCVCGTEPTRESDSWARVRSVRTGSGSACRPSADDTSRTGRKNGDDAGESTADESTEKTDPEPDAGTDDESPEVRAELAVSETTVEPGRELEFDAGDSTGDIVEYGWQFSDDAEPNLTDDAVVTHAYEEPGEYAASVVVRDETGETDTDSVRITVRDAQDGSESTSYTERIEIAIHEEINEIRADRGLPELDFSERVAEVARGHSEDMAEHGFLDHRSSDGRTLEDRYQEAGITCRVYAENVLYQPATDDPAVAASQCVESWMGSSKHRQNILDDGWSSQGIGVAVEDGRLYATQNFNDGCR